jgi:hypothetical protein
MNIVILSHESGSWKQLIHYVNKATLYIKLEIMCLVIQKITSISIL